MTGIDTAPAPARVVTTDVEAWRLPDGRVYCQTVERWPLPPPRRQS